MNELRNQTQDRPESSRELQHGFTLVEIMVVIVIIGLLATMVVRNVIDNLDDARIGTAQSNCKQLYAAAQNWKIMKGSWPTIDQLITPDERGKIAVEVLPEDPWGNAFVIRETDNNGREVMSYGPDGSENTEDDISSRQQKKDQ